MKASKQTVFALPVSILTLSMLAAWPLTVAAQDEEDTRRRTGTQSGRVDVKDEREDEAPDPNRASGLARIEPVRNIDLDDSRPVPVPDRWRILDDLGITNTDQWTNPYQRSFLKADRPVHDDWFFNFNLISDTIIEPRSFPVPVAPQGTAEPDTLNVISADGKQTVLAQTLIAGLVYYKGDTTFKPPDYEYRLTLAMNVNRVDVEPNRLLRINPVSGNTRHDQHIGLQELFFDKHLRNVSDRYDFDSLRIGIQPITADFRGFLFIDEQLGIRLFGNRDNNRWQYNIVAFRRLEKDTNTGLNDATVELRDDDVFLANLYRQDFPVLGFTSQLVAVHNRNREGEFESEADYHYDNNGFLVRPASFGLELPRNYDVSYVGYNGEGHFGRLNTTISTYYAFGTDEASPFTGLETDIEASFAAAELGFDSDWIRYRLSLLYASGDRDPYDDVEQGFDAIFENPLFAGADTSFWIRQPVPLIGGGGVALSGRNGILNSLRPSKEEGQSNFVNPGTRLAGIGVDMDLTPTFRLSLNANHLWFDRLEVLEAARQQPLDDKAIGWDVSMAATWRPFMTQNFIVRASAARLFPAPGFDALYGEELEPYSVLLNVVLAY